MLPRRFRLTRRAAKILCLQQKPRRLGVLTWVAVRNHLDYPRVAIFSGGKINEGAVGRNRQKRWLRAVVSDWLKTSRLSLDIVLRPGWAKVNSYTDYKKLIRPVFDMML